MFKTFDTNTDTYKLHYNDGVVVSTQSERKFSALVQQAKDNDHKNYSDLAPIVKAFIERSFTVNN